MNRLLLLISIVIFTSCGHLQTKQQKAESIVKSYLKTSLNDPGSYEVVSFDTLETDYESYAMGNPDGRKLDTIAASFVETSTKYRNLAEEELMKIHSNYKKMDYYRKMDTVYTKKSDSVEAIIKIKGEGYKGRITGYSIDHSYRAKNGFGALTLNKTSFWIDSTLAKVINAQESNR